MKLLGYEFYNRNPLEVAPDLLGKVLIHRTREGEISGRIVEVEAYLADKDEASHAFKGQTPRNKSLFGEAGHTYIYSIHNHYCLDVVTQGIGIPTSVLIRALEPLEGIEIMKKLRSRDKLVELTSGPGKLTQALNITKRLDGINLVSEKSELLIVDDQYKIEDIVTSGRIGISKAKEAEYRFFIKNNLFVSR